MWRTNPQGLESFDTGASQRLAGEHRYQADLSGHGDRDHCPERRGQAHPLAEILPRLCRHHHTDDSTTDHQEQWI